MISRSLKSFYYGLLSGPMRLNGIVYRNFRQPRGPLKVHLGPGQRNYIPGWVNVDANFLTAKIDVWANLEDPLPFRDASVSQVYSFHVMEHLPDFALAGHFREMYRVLEPGGTIRVGGPNADSACRKLLENDAAWFPDFPDKRSSTGGRFVNFVFCRNEHFTALTRSYLEELAADAGFRDLRFRLPVKESGYFGPEVLNLEYEDDYEHPHTILLEARKPL